MGSRAPDILSGGKQAKDVTLMTGSLLRCSTRKCGRPKDASSKQNIKQVASSPTHDSTINIYFRLFDGHSGNAKKERRDGWPARTGIWKECDGPPTGYPAGAHGRMPPWAERLTPVDCTRSAYME
jgi:hypothetical protein